MLCLQMQVYLVATAHISAQSQEDVTTTIEKTNPSYVVLELDKERLDKITEAADKGDRYGLMRARNVSLSSLVGMALSGELLPFVFGTVYVISGATMGTRPGGVSDVLARV
jgi:pheromone shutdown protein TraB